MAIRRAHMASFPERQHVLPAALRSIAPQVDEIHLVLNEFRAIPGFLAEFSKVNPILASEDFKDVGKFVTRPADDDHVFFVDDDLCYGSGYCDWITRRAEAIGLEANVFGLHASIYRRTDGADSKSRKIFHYRKPLRQTVHVDQVATNSTFAIGKNVPPLDYMRGSQKFVDVRYARWCYENNLDQIALARPFGLASPLRHGGDTIYRTFTVVSPKHVLDEIRSFAGNSPLVGQRIGDRLGVLQLFRAA